MTKDSIAQRVWGVAAARRNPPMQWSEAALAVAIHDANPRPPASEWWHVPREDSVVPP